MHIHNEVIYHISETVQVRIFPPPSYDELSVVLPDHLHIRNQYIFHLLLPLPPLGKYVPMCLYLFLFSTCLGMHHDIPSQSTEKIFCTTATHASSFVIPRISGHFVVLLDYRYRQNHSRDQNIPTERYINITQINKIKIFSA